MEQCKLTQPFGKQFGSMYQERQKTSKSLDLVIPFLGIYPKEIILNRDEGLCTKIFNIISFITEKRKYLNFPIMGRKRKFSKLQDNFLMDIVWPLMIPKNNKGGKLMI